MGEIPRTEEPDTMTSEHLAEGIPPILACVGTFMEQKEAIEAIEKFGENVDFYADAETLKRKGNKNSGVYTYNISRINENSKFTRGLLDCTSLIVVGRDKTTGNEISFLTHQEPRNISSLHKDEFLNQLAGSLNEMQERCLPGTVDAVIVGGQTSLSKYKGYQESLKVIGYMVREVLAFDALVICGPKNSGQDDICFDTQKRRLHIRRPDPYNVLHNEPFKVGDEANRSERWAEESK